MPSRRKPQERQRTVVTVGKRLAEIRRARGLTQRELAEKLGVGQSLISHFEAGRRTFDSHLMLELTEILHVSADDLLGRIVPRSDSTEITRPFLKRLRKIEQLSRRDREAVLRTLDAFLTKAS